MAALKNYGFPPNAEVPTVPGPFPTDPKFKVELFNSLPLDLQSHKKYIKKHHGSLGKWTGVFMHPAVWTRFDLGYAIMRLAGYMSAPTSAAYEALEHFMQYLFHHPHMLIMYPWKQLKKKKQMELHWSHGDAELLRHNDMLVNYANADHARDPSDR